MRCLILSVKAFEIAFDRFLNSEIKGIGDNGMPDAYFIEAGERREEEPKIFQIQVVAGIHAESGLGGYPRALYERPYGSFRIIGE